MTFKCDNEVLWVLKNGEWEFVAEHYDSLSYTFRCIADAIGVDYKFIEE